VRGPDFPFRFVFRRFPLADNLILYDQIERMPIGDLVPYAKNSRTHSDAQISQIIAPIQEFGFTNPVLISDAGEIIAGHGRVLAAAGIGMSVVPCVCLSHRSQTKRRGPDSRYRFVCCKSAARPICPKGEAARGNGRGKMVSFIHQLFWE
jgi:hypothetical protein